MADIYNWSESPAVTVGVHTVQTSHYPPLTTMLSTSKNVLFLGHNHLLTTDADDPG